MLDQVCDAGVGELLVSSADTKRQRRAKLRRALGPEYWDAVNIHPVRIARTESAALHAGIASHT